MSRPPHARARILAASRELLRSGGARCLTLGNLEVTAKVTRGGVLYHWPNREALVAALVRQDVDQWSQRCLEGLEDGDAVKAHVRCALSAQDGVGETTAVLLPELRQFPDLQAALKARCDELFTDWQWDDVDLHRYVMLLAAEGAFWRRVHAMTPDVPGLDARVGEWIENLLDATAPATACGNQAVAHA